jgi:WD40 repeat protein
VWDADSGELLHTITGHEDFVLGASYSPDGETIVTTSSDGTAQMWDASTFEWKLTMSGHSGSVFTAAFNLDGDQIATASYDGTVKLWDAGTGAELLNISSPSGVGGAVFSPDGRRLYTAQVDGFDRVYLLDTEELLALARQRLTRTFTDDECRRYLHLEECPPLP